MACSNGCAAVPSIPPSLGVDRFAERHACATEVAPATLRMTGLRVTALSFVPSFDAMAMSLSQSPAV